MLPKHGREARRERDEAVMTNPTQINQGGAKNQERQLPEQTGSSPSGEVLPPGYDAQRRGKTSGQMDEHQHIHDIKDELLPKTNTMDVPGLHSDREGLSIGADGQPLEKNEKQGRDDMGFPKEDESKFG